MLACPVPQFEPVPDRKVAVPALPPEEVAVNPPDVIIVFSPEVAVMILVVPTAEILNAVVVKVLRF